MRDVYAGAEFFHPESQTQGQKDSIFRIRNKKFKYFNLTPKFFPDLNLLPIPDLGTKKAPDPGSRYETLLTAAPRLALAPSILTRFHKVAC
jgi:hypothetical protein